MSQYDPLSFFDNDVSPAAVAAAAEPAAPAVVETPAPVVEAPAAVEKPEFDGAPAGYVPVGALKAEREKRQSLEDQVAQSKKAPAPAATQPQAPVVIPQPGTPEHAAYLQDMIYQQQIDGKFNLSEARFVASNGVEETKKLQEWVDTQDVFFFQRLLNSNDPYADAKKAYDQDQAATAFKAIPADELTAYREWKAAQTANGGQPVVPAATPVKPAAVAPSVHAAAQKESLTKPVSSGTILQTPSASGVKPGETPAAPGAAFANIFN